MYLYALLIFMILCVISKVLTFYVHHHSFPIEKNKDKKPNILSKIFYSSITIFFNVNIQVKIL